MLQQSVEVWRLKEGTQGETHYHGVIVRDLFEVEHVSRVGVSTELASETVKACSLYLGKGPTVHVQCFAGGMYRIILLPETMLPVDVHKACAFCGK